MASQTEGIKFDVYKAVSNRPLDGVLRKTILRDDLKVDEVLVKITHSGLSSLDVYYQELSPNFGHAGVGIVQNVGPDVVILKKDDVVGFSYIDVTCRVCPECLAGHEDSCPARFSYGDCIGSLASYTVWHEASLSKIPASMDHEHDAALLCGGTTIFNILTNYDVKPSDRIGIVGVGSLGQLAIQFAAKISYEIVVFNQTENKRGFAMELGAHEYYATEGLGNNKVSQLVDHLLVTTGYWPLWPIYMPVLAPGATIYPLTLGRGELKIPAEVFMFKGLRIQGSLATSMSVQTKMLEFADRHKIKPAIEIFALDIPGIEQCIRKFLLHNLLSLPMSKAVLVANEEKEKSTSAKPLEANSITPAPTKVSEKSGSENF